jgi:flagellar hook-associated protein 3 FlgL
MMTNNSLNNISNNKKRMSVLENQYSTRQKIQRPSEDPVVAVRSLKYSTQITESTQYQKNISDAFNWMDMTESSIKSISSLLSSTDNGAAKTYFTQGANGTLENYDRDSIVQVLSEYKNHVSDMLNTDYAGRYLFTGFRTDTPIHFDEAETNYTYSIKESFTFTDIQATSYVKGGARYDANSTADDYAQEAPTLETAQKIKLSYSNTDGDDTANPPQVPTITFVAKDGTETDATGAIKIVSVAEAGGACYDAADDEIIYIKETGELVLGKDYYDMAQSSASINVAYEKSSFEEGDIRPEHYFECSATNLTTGVTIDYTSPDVQNIQYEVNFSQMFTVNTLGKDVIPTSFFSKIDELIQGVNDVFNMDTEIAKVEKLIETETDETKLEALNQLKEDLETERTLKEKILQDAFSNGLTVLDDTLEQINAALGNHGSRYNRLTLTKSRMTDQLTAFTELKSDNDGVELEEAIVNYNDAYVTYQASLSCASKVVKTTLLDFL